MAFVCPAEAAGNKEQMDFRAIESTLQSSQMCRKIKKLAWYTDEDALEQKLDYRFLELLVLFESKSNISDRLRKAGMTKKYSDYFLDQLRPLLENPNKYLATYLKRTFHPGLEEKKMSPEMAAFLQDVQERVQISSRRTKSRSQNAQMLRDEDWTVVTPVPHIRCPCHPRRTYTPIVTKEERMAVEMQKTDLCFREQIMGIRRERELHSSLEHFIPGYQRVASRERLPPRPSSVPSMLEVPRGANAFERLSAPRERLPSRSPCHASACDAYRQGIATKERLGEAGGAASRTAKKPRRRRAKQYREMPTEFIRLC